MRLNRSWPHLLATGFVGGVDLGLGVVAFFVIVHLTGSTVLGALAFTIGFIALTLGRSELFTENFLVPVAAVAARGSTPRALLRLWAGTAAFNLAGGWVLMGVVMAASPELRGTAVDVGRHPVEVGIGLTSFASAVLGGTIITLMTWMERGTDSMPAKLVAAAAAGFLLAAGKLQHVIVISLEAFAALQVGAPFGYADWLGMAAWAALGNIVGGLGLVTGLRLIQVGGTVLDQERDRSLREQEGEDDVDGSEDAARAEATPR